MVLHSRTSDSGGYFCPLGLKRTGLQNSARAVAVEGRSSKASQLQRNSLSKGWPSWQAGNTHSNLSFFALSNLILMPCIDQIHLKAISQRTQVKHSIEVSLLGRGQVQHGREGSWRGIHRKTSRVVDIPRLGRTEQVCVYICHIPQTSSQYSTS